MDATPADARTAALARLAATRRQLAHEMLPEPEDDAAPRAHGPLTRRLRVVWRRWRRRCARSPVANAALQALQAWWQASPWRVAGETVADEVHRSALPWVRRHPVATVAAAAATGAALVAGRRFLWPLMLPPLLSVPRRVVQGVLGLVMQAPIQTLLAGLLMAGARSTHEATDEGTADEPR